MDVFNSTSEYLELIEKYRLIAENMDECIWIFDLANRRFKYISPSIFNLRGLTVEEAMNEKLEECLTSESLKKIQAQGMTRLPQFLSGDRSENIESSIEEYDQYCKDGTIKTIEISTKLIINNETNSIDILGVSRDVSYRKKLNNNAKNKLENVNELFGINNGRIYCFGKLLVYGNSSNSLVKWRTHKSEELFAYLLENREQPISKWKIFEDLWPQYSPDKVNNLLHTSLYKIKKALKLANINFEIKFINGCYYFSIPDAYIDSEEFDSIISSNMIITEDTAKRYRKAFELYKDHYLEENYFSWSLIKKEIYSSKYYQLGKNLISYYLKTELYVEAEKKINRILEKYPLDEFANETCLKLYYIKNDRAAFIHQYQLTQKLFKDELGIQPNFQIQELYKAAISKFLV